MYQFVILSLLIFGGCVIRSKNYLPFAIAWIHPRSFVGPVLLGFKLYMYVCRSLFVLLSVGHCVVCPATYWFWLPLWYLQTVLANIFGFQCCVCVFVFVFVFVGLRHVPRVPKVGSFSGFSILDCYFVLFYLMFISTVHDSGRFENMLNHTHLYWTYFVS